MELMIDLEMFSTRPTAQIVQIGAIFFEGHSGGKIYHSPEQSMNRTVKIQDGAGAIDHETIAWWLRQPNAKTLGEAMSSSDAWPLVDALNELAELPKKAGLDWEQIEGVWSKPSNVDLAILAHAYSLFGTEPPWEHWKTNCAKTIYRQVGGMPPVDTTGMQLHDAHTDALVQAMALQKALGTLNGKRR